MPVHRRQHFVSVQSMKPLSEACRRLLDTMPQGIIISDSATHVLFANRAAEALLKLPLPKLRAMRLYDRVHPDDQRHVRDYAQRLKSEQHMITKRRFKAGDGEYVHIERNVQLLRDGTQLSICRDVTNEDEDRQRQDLFISITGHELRGPLSSIKIDTELLSRTLAGPARAHTSRLLRDIDEQIERQRRMLDDLLDLSRIREGKFSVHMERFDLKRNLEKVVLHTRRITRRKIKLLVPALDGSMAEGDKDRLYQVFFNLLTNAAKFSEPKAPIEVALTKTDRAWVISVKDHGIGIKAEDQLRIFDVFYQAGHGIHSGIGVGLFLAAAIMRLHGGSIDVKSEHGSWTVFTVLLPLEQDRQATARPSDSDIFGVW